MKRSERLGVVLDLATKTADKAAEVVAKVRQQLLAEEQKLEDLRRYYNEYEKVFSTQQTAIRALDMARQRAFLGQLTQAQQQQLVVIDQRRGLLAAKQKIWQVAHLKQQAIAQLIERLKKDENLALTRKEEKRLDEFTQQASRRRNRETH